MWVTILRATRTRRNGSGLPDPLPSLVPNSASGINAMVAHPIARIPDFLGGVSPARSSEHPRPSRTEGTAGVNAQKDLPTSRAADFR